MKKGFEVKEIKKYSYSIFSSMQNANDVVSVIMLSGDKVFYGYVNFLVDGSELPQAEKKYGLYYLYYHQKDLPALIDMMRNESPVFIIYMEGKSSNCRITTMPEPIGEGEN